MDCHIDVNKAKCSCTYEPCSRKGQCCECISHHLKSEELPGCAFTSEVERTYDRSYDRFVQAFNARSSRKG